MDRDHPEHHLNTLAGELAVAAVYEVGVYMKSIWEKDGRYTLKDLEILIDKKYFRHPADTDWMKDLVEEWINNNQEKVTRAKYRSHTEYVLKMGDKALDKFDPSHDHDIRKYLLKKIDQIDEAFRKN